MASPSGQKSMFVIERTAPHLGFFARQFIIDCPHATTTHTAQDYPKTDPARASGIISNLLRQHRDTVAAAVAAGAEDELCTCQPQRTAVPS